MSGGKDTGCVGFLSAAKVKLKVEFMDAADPLSGFINTEHNEEARGLYQKSSEQFGIIFISDADR